MYKPRIIPILAVAFTVLLGLPAHADVESSSSLSSVGCQVRETALGDLAADAVRTVGGTPIALIPAGGFREITIPKGKVKSEDILECLQYPDDRLVVIELTGEQLTRALERSVSVYPQKNLGFLQARGMSSAAVFTLNRMP